MTPNAASILRRLTSLETQMRKETKPATKRRLADMLAIVTLTLEDAIGPDLTRQYTSQALANAQRNIYGREI
jgi:hypothetical protein